MKANPPAINRRMVEGLLSELLANPKPLRLVLVHGRYEGTDTEFVTTLPGAKRRVRVADQHSVLGIVDTWQQHQADTEGTDDLLVITTGVDDSQLGWDLRAHAIRNSTQTVNTAEIIKHRFGAVHVDSRIRRETWLLDALLDAEPSTGWRRAGGVLTKDAAIAALVEARLGLPTVRNGAPDIATLLAWSCSPGADRFATLSPAERDGIASWLGDTVGGAAPVVLGLAAEGRSADVMPLGVIGGAVAHPDAGRDAALALGGLGIRSQAQLEPLVRAVEDTLTRWISDTSSDGTGRARALDVVRRADDLASGVGLGTAIAGSQFALSGFQARLRALAEKLTSTRGRADVVANAEAALAEVRDHALARLLPDRVLVADTAVRLRRWLAEPEPTVASVAAGVRSHFAEWGWVDRALTLLWNGDPVADPLVAKAYGAVHVDARARRDRLDETFGTHLRVWTTGATSLAPAGALLIEDVLATVVRPLRGAPPLVIVLDGMSSAVAVELAEELTGEGWLEASPTSAERVAAVAMIPSVTLASRASLLCGKAVTGSKQVERTGFAAFWRQHQVQAQLLHSADVVGAGGHRLSGPVLEALAGDAVLGVVLNTIDDALDHGREGGRTGWRVADITYLRDLLDAARMYGRPVVLVADHGHVLEHSPAGQGPSDVDGVESARWRVGTPVDGEIELAGPRVLYGDGRIVVPWREDVRYVKRRAGYHGGAALAEMTVPVLVFLPQPDLLPTGWAVLSKEAVTPGWWEPRRTTLPVAEPVTGRKSRRVTESRDDAAEALFPVVPALSPSMPTLGEFVVVTDVYKTHKAFVRKAPDAKIISEIIDLLVAADGTMSLVAVAAKAGRAGRNPDFFATTLQRLLNVEGYPVLSLADGGRTVRLNVPLLREQFGVVAK